MKASLLTRRLHAWTLTILAIPLLVISVTGVALQLKKSSDWIQPTEVRGAQGSPSLTFSRLLEICRGVPELGVSDWSDIKRVDLRPNSGVLKVTTENAWEAQLDPTSGRVLSVAVRRSDVIEALHDGSWFHPLVKDWLFLPTGVLLAAGVLTGIYLFVLPALNRRRASFRTRRLTRISETQEPTGPQPHAVVARPSIRTDFEPT